MIKALIFDFDGTIANTLPYSFSKIIEISKKYQVKKSEEEIIKKISHLTPFQLMKEFKIAWFKIPVILWEIRKAQELLYEKIDEIEIFPSLKETLIKLKKEGYLLYIFSSNIKKNIIRFLNKEKIDNLFEKIYTGSNFLAKDKDLISIIKKEGLKKDEVLYIADEIRDVLACKKAGIKMIGVSWGLAGEKVLKREKVDFLIKKPREVFQLLDLVKNKKENLD